MANHYRQFSVAVRLQGELAGAFVTELLHERRDTWQQLADADEHDAADDLGIDFEWSIEHGCLYLTDDGERGNVKHVAALLRELMRLGYVQEPVSVYWADICSKPRPDEFMGGAALVTERKTYWFVLPEIVEKKARAIERLRKATA